MTDLDQFFEGDSAIEELRSAVDGDELCGLLLQSRGGWGDSTRVAEAVELLRGVQGSSDLPASFVAVMLCTCDRWYRCTAKLVAALEASGLLTEDELDELAEAFLSPEIEIVHPIGLTHPDWTTEFVDEASGKIYTLGPDTKCHAIRRPEPPMRRWAAARRLRRDPAAYRELRDVARALHDPRHREAVTHGLLDSANVLELDNRRELVRHGLRCSLASVRRRALDRLAELDGPEVAMRRARRDRNARVQAWKWSASTALSSPGVDQCDGRGDRVQGGGTGPR